MTRILGETCAAQTRQTNRLEGFVAVAGSSPLFGEIGTTELFNTPEVIAVARSLDKYIDIRKLQSLK